MMHRRSRADPKSGVPAHALQFIAREQLGLPGGVRLEGIVGPECVLCGAIARIDIAEREVDVPLSPRGIGEAVSLGK